MRAPARRPARLEVLPHRSALQGRRTTASPDHRLQYESSSKGAARCVHVFSLGTAIISPFNGFCLPPDVPIIPCGQIFWCHGQIHHFTIFPLKQLPTGISKNYACPKSPHDQYQEHHSLDLNTRYFKTLNLLA